MVMQNTDLDSVTKCMNNDCLQEEVQQLLKTLTQLERLWWLCAGSLVFFWGISWLSM